MTSIVGITHNGKIFMGGDSCCGTPESWLPVSSPKVFCCGRFLLGCSGSFRMLDLLRFSLTVDRQSCTQCTDGYIRTTFINTIRKLFRKHEFHLDDEESGGNILLGYRGSLYEIQPDYSVLNVPLWGHAIGSGEAAARGSLYTTRAETDCSKRILMALEAAEATTPSVRAPFTLIQGAC